MSWVSFLLTSYPEFDRFIQQLTRSCLRQNCLIFRDRPEPVFFPVPLNQNASGLTVTKITTPLLGRLQYQRHPDRNVSKASAFIGNKHSKWWSLSIFPFRSSSAACLHLITFLQMFVPKPSVCFLLMSKMFSHAFQWKCHPFMRRWWNREKTMRNHSKAINNDYATISHIRLSNLNWIYDYV